MDGLWKNFGAFFLAIKITTHKFFKQSFLVFLTHLIFFLALAFLVRWFLDYFFTEAIFKSLADRSLYFKPFYFISRFLGNPLLLLFLPIILFLSYNLTLILASLLTGTFLDSLSQSAEQNAGPLSNTPPAISSSSRFLFELLEELKLLAINISWTGALFFLALIPEANENFLLLLFILGIIFFEGWNYLSFSMLRWKVPQITQGKIYFKNFRAFLGFSLAASLGFWAIYFALGYLPYRSLAFISIFIFLSLFKPLGVVAGSRLAVNLINLGKPARPRGKFGRFLEIFTALFALMILFSYGQFVLAARSKLGLLKCNYQLKNIQMKTPSEESKETVDKLLSYAKLIASPEINGALNVQNNSDKTILLENFYLNGYIGKRLIGILSLKGFQLSPGENENLELKFTVNGFAVAQALMENLAGQNKLDFKLKILVDLDLWFGKVPYTIIQL